MMNQHFPARAFSLFAVAIMLAAGLPVMPPFVGTAQAGATQTEENWDLGGPSWTYSGGLLVGPDCQPGPEHAYGGVGCSLVVDSKTNGQTVKAERNASLTLSPPGYVVSFLFRNDWPYSWSTSWFTMRFLDGSHIKLDVTHGDPHNRVRLYANGSATGAFYRYDEKVWYQAVIKVDLVNGKVRAEIRDPETGLRHGNSSSLTLPAGGDRIGLVSFEGAYTGSNPVQEAPQPMNFDNFRIRLPDPPSAPSLTATAGPGVGQIRLSWPEVFDDGGVPVLYYHVHRSDTSGGPATLVANTTGMSFTDSDLGNGVTRYYTVKAVNAVGSSPSSTQAVATTFNHPGAPSAFTAAPGAGVGQVRLNWVAPPNGGTPITGYKVYRGSTSGSATFLTDVSGGTTTFTDSYRPNGTLWHYNVTAVNLVGEGSSSPEAASLPKPDAAHPATGMVVSPAAGWTGDARTLSFTYNVALSQCSPGETCPVEHEWRVYQDGSPGGLDGTLLASGTNTHPGHSENASFPVTTTITPSGVDGTHLLKVAVNPRSGSTQWAMAGANFQLDAPVPGRITGPTTPQLNRSTAAAGSQVHVNASYEVFQKQCRSTDTCPIPNEWKILLDGWPTTPDGMVLDQGTHAHPAHGETVTYALSRSVTIPPDTGLGPHYLKVAARANGTSPWQVAATLLTTTTLDTDRILFQPDLDNTTYANTAAGMAYGVESAGASAWSLGVPSVGAHSGNHSWGVGLNGAYPPLTDASLVLKGVDLTSATSATLRFWTRHDTERGVDGGRVLVRPEGSTTPTPIEPAAGPAYATLADGTRAWTGTSNGWQEAAFNLTSYAGQRVEMLFQFRSDALVGLPHGWLMDDLTVEKNGVVVHADDFESSWTRNGAWTLTSPTTGPAGGHGSQNAWSIAPNAPYSNGTRSVLELPRVDLTDPTATLTFRQWLDAEHAGERAWLEISEDQGASWRTLEPFQGPPYASFPDGARAWSGNTLGWTQSTFELTPFVGGPLHARFVFESDDTVSDVGWFLSDFKIQSSAPGLAPGTPYGSRVNESGAFYAYFANGYTEASFTTPGGKTITLRYVGTGGDVVARLTANGTLTARRSIVGPFGPTGVPASDFVITGGSWLHEPTWGTWTVRGAPGSLQGIVGATRLEAGGKVFDDVATVSEPIEGDSLGRISAGGRATLSWNWHDQPATRYDTDGLGSENNPPETDADKRLFHDPDTDQDGHGDKDELRKNSDPDAATSTPLADDDGDGLANLAEASRPAAQSAAQTTPGGLVHRDFGLKNRTLARRSQVTYYPNLNGSLPDHDADGVQDAFDSVNAPAEALLAVDAESVVQVTTARSDRQVLVLIPPDWSGALLVDLNSGVPSGAQTTTRSAFLGEYQAYATAAGLGQDLNRILDAFLTPSMTYHHVRATATPGAASSVSLDVFNGTPADGTWTILRDLGVTRLDLNVGGSTVSSTHAYRDLPSAHVLRTGWFFLHPADGTTRCLTYHAYYRTSGCDDVPSPFGMRLYSRQADQSVLALLDRLASEYRGAATLPAVYTAAYDALDRLPTDPAPGTARWIPYAGSLGGAVRDLGLAAHGRGFAVVDGTDLSYLNATGAWDAVATRSTVADHALHAVSALSRNEAWYAGGCKADGTGKEFVLRLHIDARGPRQDVYYNPTGLNAALSTCPGAFTSIKAFSPSDVWAAGSLGIWHYDGAAWTRRLDASVDHMRFLSRDDAFAARSNADGTAQLHRWNGATWSPAGTARWSQPTSNMSGSFTLGADGTIWNVDQRGDVAGANRANEWSSACQCWNARDIPAAGGPHAALETIKGVGPGEAWAAGRGLDATGRLVGVVAHYANGHWQWVPETEGGFGGSSTFHSIDFTSPTEGWIGDATGRLYRYTATNTPPVADFTLDRVAGSTLDAFEADAGASRDADGDSLTYAWDWGDKTAPGHGILASHRYRDEGTYALTLLVTDARGATTTTTRTVTITRHALQGDVDLTAGFTAAGQEDHYTFTVPLGALALRLTLSGPEGADFDLYAKRDTTPTPSVHDLTGATSNASEDVQLLLPQAGTYVVKVRSHAGAGAYTLRASTMPGLVTESAGARTVDHYEPIDHDPHGGFLPSQAWTTSSPTRDDEPSWRVVNRHGTPVLWFGGNTTGTYASPNGRAGGSVLSPRIALSGEASEHHARFWTYDDTEAHDTKQVYLQPETGPEQLLLTLDDETHDHEGWWPITLNLTAWTGQTVRLRFAIDTTDGADNGGEGWFIDDLLVGSDTRCSEARPYHTAFANNTPGATSYARPYAYVLNGSLAPLRVRGLHECLDGLHPDGPRANEVAENGALLDWSRVAGRTLALYPAWGGNVSFLVGGDGDGSGTLGDSPLDCLQGPFVATGTPTCAADAAGNSVLIVIPPPDGTPLFNRLDDRLPIRICIPGALGLGGPCPLGTPLWEDDEDMDGWGDRWRKEAEKAAQKLIDRVSDQESLANGMAGDGATNIEDFHWQTWPIGPVADLLPNARDLDSDGWEDGPEIHYWNDPKDDPSINSTEWAALRLSPYDPQFSLNFDTDLALTTTHDNDSDNDGLLDGAEFNTWHTYPEHPDSDCALAATSCLAPSEYGSHGNTAASGAGQGTGDGIGDLEEAAAWNDLSSTHWYNDFDEDGIANNLRDPDADGDEVLDGQELACPEPPCTDPTAFDTDNDGLLDGGNVVLQPGDRRMRRFLESGVVHERGTDGRVVFLGENNTGTDPLKWDSEATADEPGDGLPDGWEARHQLAPLVKDADLDKDGDGLYNIEEYEHLCPSTPCGVPVWWGGTNPGRADTDFDRLNDYAEIRVHGTKPLQPDHDLDGLLDGDEVLVYGPSQGTDPKLLDSDDDGLTDYQEVITYAADGVKANNPNTDRSWNYTNDDTFNDYQEVVQYRTEATRWDTDNDGRADGRDANPLQYDEAPPQMDLPPLNPLDQDHTAYVVFRHDGYVDVMVQDVHGTEVEVQGVEAKVRLTGRCTFATSCTADVHHEARRLDDGTWGARIGLPKGMLEATYEKFTLVVLSARGNYADGTGGVAYTGEFTEWLPGVEWTSEPDPVNQNNVDPEDDWESLEWHKSEARAGPVQGGSGGPAASLPDPYTLGLDELFALYGNFSVYRLKPYALVQDHLANATNSSVFGLLRPLLGNATGNETGNDTPSLGNFTLVENAFVYVDPLLEPGVYGTMADGGNSYFRTPRWLRTGLMKAGAAIVDEGGAQVCSFLFGSDDPRAKGRMTGDLIAGILVWGDIRDCAVGTIHKDWLKAGLGCVGILLNFVPGAEGPFAAFKASINTIAKAPGVGTGVAIGLLAKTKDMVKSAKPDAALGFRVVMKQADTARWLSVNGDRMVDYNRVQEALKDGDSFILFNTGQEVSSIMDVSRDVGVAFASRADNGKDVFKTITGKNEMYPNGGGAKALDELTETSKLVRDSYPQDSVEFVKGIADAGTANGVGYLGASGWWSNIQSNLKGNIVTGRGFVLEGKLAGRLHDGLTIVENGVPAGTLKLQKLDTYYPVTLRDGSSSSTRVDFVATLDNDIEVFMEAKFTANAAVPNDKPAQLETYAAIARGKASAGKKGEAIYALEKPPTRELWDHAKDLSRPWNENSPMDGGYGVKIRFIDAKTGKVFTEGEAL